MTWFRNRYTLCVTYAYISTGYATNTLQLIDKTDLATISKFLHQFDNYENVTFTVLDRKDNKEISVDEIDIDNLIIEM